jgi:UDP-GlcNAc:undecaprenyl-phosphate/decaprenyl-phosphate GlcNAc-1-phosphate transferase
MTQQSKIGLTPGYFLARCLPALAIISILLIRDPVRWWFFSSGHLRALYLAIFASAMAFLLTPVAMYLARVLGAIDQPAARKMHATPTPLMGGFAIFVAFTATIFINNLYTEEVKGVAIAATLVYLIGALDDIKPLSAKLRLVIQLTAVAIMIEYGVRVSFMPDSWWGDGLEILFTVVWMIGMTNAVNFLDGLDGLAAGTIMIYAAIFSFISFEMGQPYMRFLSIALMGSCLGFLPYNFRVRRPARIFLGDGGSNFLGFTVAAIGILGDWGTGSSSVDLIVPILIMGVPIFDTTLTTFLRIKYGQVRNFAEWIHFTGKDHFHHRLVEIGFSVRRSVVAIYLVSVILGIGAMVLRKSDGLDAVLLLVQAFILFTMIGYFMVYVKEHFNLKS